MGLVNRLTIRLERTAAIVRHISLRWGHHLNAIARQEVLAHSLHSGTVRAIHTDNFRRGTFLPTNTSLGLNIMDLLDNRIQDLIIDTTMLGLNITDSQDSRAQDLVDIPADEVERRKTPRTYNQVSVATSQRTL